ncbi:DUF294 nucleotidyltransferase-like domain-containing protein [Xanthobacter sp. TB0139]|uniref:DUF294 nucleotidyltransferase-like domain-containing protein n=1 Tax=Xanthobacter sp. TB0139 TaxID=3459178 RepID=UPI00403A27B1
MAPESSNPSVPGQGPAQNRPEEHGSPRKGRAGAHSASASIPGPDQREFISLMSSRVGEAYVRKPFFVEGDTDLVTLCKELSRLGLSDALVRDGGRLGVFTTTNLRDALARGEAPASMAVRDVSTFEPWSVSVDDELYDALILMLRHRIHRVVVRDGEKVVGLLGQLDLMAFVASHSHLISLEISGAQTVAGLKAAAAQIDSLITVLNEDGVRVGIIARLVGELNRLLFRRLWELLAPEALRRNSCLLVMGSEGRGEQIIKTDQDNALLLRDGFECPELEQVTAAFTAALIDFGYPPCPGGIMLSRPLWCQSVASFRKTLAAWLFDATAEGPMNLAIFLDADVVAGDEALLDEARAHLTRLLQDDAAYYARFAMAVEQFTAPGSWWSRLPGLRGRDAAEIDIKKLGLFPVVHGVRALALEFRVKACSTTGRLDELVKEKRLEAPLARDIADALHCLMGLKLGNNLRQMARGEKPGNSIRLSDLGTLDKQALKDSLAIVRQFREWLGRHYRFDRL